MNGERRKGNRHLPLTQTEMNAAPAVHTENSVAPLAGSGGSCRPTTQAVMGPLLDSRTVVDRK